MLSLIRSLPLIALGAWAFSLSWCLGSLKAQTPAAPEAPKATAPATAPAATPAEGLTADKLGNLWPAKGPAFLSPETVSQSATNVGCPTQGYDISLSYPTGIGDEDLDEMNRDRFWEIFLEERDVAIENSQCPADPKEAAPGRSEFKLTFKADAPSPGYLSVLYEEFSFPAGAAHPNTELYSATYIIAEGRTMDLVDLFPDVKKSTPLFWAYLGPKWCALKKGTVPSFYGSGECPANGVPTLPEAYKGDDLILPDLGNPVLTPQGLTLNLGAYEAWSHADGPQTLTIPLAELVKIGADPKIWAQK